MSRDNKKLLPFLQQNNDKINVNELELNKIIKMRDYKKLTKKLKIQTYDEYFYAEERKNEKKIAKYKSIVCSNFALIIGYLCETKYLNIAIIILLEQGGLIIHREKGDRNE